MKASYGEQLLREFVACMLPRLETIYNYRPDWLHGLEIDIFFPEIDAGLEFQGDQHYCYTETYGDSTDQQWRDKRKKQLCRERGIMLVTVEASDLEYTKLTHPFRRLTRPFRMSLPSKMRKEYKPNMTDKDKLRRLNKNAIAYRKRLITSYNSPSARRRKSKVRKAAMDAARTKERRE